MPLLPSSSRRSLKHTRSIQIEAYVREDGLWDLDAHITDIKTSDFLLASGVRAAGAPIHDMWLRITIDRKLSIVEVQAVSDAVPYVGSCEQIGPDYRKLVGLNLMQGFRRQLQERLGGTQGCAHLTELAQILPTAAIQAFSGEVFGTGEADSGDAQATKPFQLDHCHALRSDGATVEKYYPRWAIKPVETQSSE